MYIQGLINELKDMNAIWKPLSTEEGNSIECDVFKNAIRKGRGIRRNHGQQKE